VLPRSILHYHRQTPTFTVSNHILCQIVLPVLFLLPYPPLRASARPWLPSSSHRHSCRIDATQTKPGWNHLSYCLILSQVVSMDDRSLNISFYPNHVLYLSISHRNSHRIDATRIEAENHCLTRSAVWIVGHSGVAWLRTLLVAASMQPHPGRCWERERWEVVYRTEAGILCRIYFYAIIATLPRVFCAACYILISLYCYCVRKGLRDIGVYWFDFIT
jgi:hypothetical protein